MTHLWIWYTKDGFDWTLHLVVQYPRVHFLCALTFYLATSVNNDLYFRCISLQRFLNTESRSFLQSIVICTFFGTCQKILPLFLLIGRLFDWFIGWLSDWCVNGYMNSRVGQLFCLFVDWLMGWWVDWLIDWWFEGLTDRLVDFWNSLTLLLLTAQVKRKDGNCSGCVPAASLAGLPFALHLPCFSFLPIAFFLVLEIHPHMIFV